jgi:hypothetical protein
LADPPIAGWPAERQGLGQVWQNGAVVLVPRAALLHNVGEVAAATALIGSDPLQTARWGSLGKTNPRR